MMPDLKRWISDLDRAEVPLGALPHGEPAPRQLERVLSAHRLVIVAVALAIGLVPIGLIVSSRLRHAPKPPSSLTGEVPGSRSMQASPEIFAMDFVDARNGFLVRCGSTAPGDACAKLVLLATNDGGKTWKPRGAAPSSVLAFQSVSDGIAFATPGCRSNCVVHVLGTSDGGRTWVPIGTIPTSGASLHGPFTGASVSFPDPSDGWLLADGFWHTSDGGTTWNALSFRCPLNASLTGMSFVDAQTGFLVCESEGAGGSAPKMLFRTNSAGAAWSLVSRSGFESWGGHSYPDIGRMSQGGYNSRLQFVTSQVGYLLTDRGGVSETTDGGRTFHDVVITDDAYSPVGMAPTGRRSAVLALLQGALLRTTDGGRTWTQLYPAPTLLIHTAAVSSAGDGIAIGSLGIGGGRQVGPSQGMYATHDDGSTWSRVTSIPGLTSEFQLMAPAPHVAYAFNIARRGALFRSDDDGMTWQSLGLPGRHSIRVTFATPSAGFASDSSGAIYRTSDGGSSWTLVGNHAALILGPATPSATASFGATLWAFPTGESGGITGGLVRSTDGGRTFTPFSLGPGLHAEGVASIDDAHIWISGWVCPPAPSPSPSQPADVKPTSCRGSRPTLLRTSDGGATWQTIYLSTLPDPISFVSPTTGFGMGATLLVTHDGGVTWKPPNGSTTQSPSG